MFLSSLAWIELETGEIYSKDSVVATCSTAVGTDDFIGSLLTLEATKSCAQGTDGYVRCLGTTGGCAAPTKLETGGLWAMAVTKAVTGDDDNEGAEIGNDGGGVRGGIGNDGHTHDAAEMCAAGGGSDTRLLWSHLTEDSCMASTSPKSP